MTRAMPAEDAPDAETAHELVLTRLIDVPRAKLYRAWTDAELLKKWFVPAPWTIADVDIDVRPGGRSHVVMRDPEGNDHPSDGVYLELVENERIVFTDAYTEGWVPSAKPFFTAIVTFADEAGKTRYTARALHWREEDRAAHEKMGFHEGWGICADQLAAVAAKL